ncbi:MAG: hypothetical protein ACREBU_22085, partial [Nitrososphaera sp.]
LIVARFATPSDIGQATALYSLVMVANTVVQLGLEYPLLKRSMSDRRHIFGTVLLIEIGFACVSMPIVYLVASSLYGESEQLVLITLGMLLLSVVGFASRYSILGFSNVRRLLISDSLGTIVKFTSAWFLLSAGYAELGILTSLLLGIIVTATLNLRLATRLFGLKRGDIQYMKSVIREGLANAPSKLSGSLIIINLSVVLLASFGTDSAQLGVFYIAMMLSAVVSGFSGSLAFMSIPASAATNKDLSSNSLRMGLSFTAPAITALIIAPSAILSVIGNEYSEASISLVILAVSVIPGIVVSNTISRLNNSGEYRKILMLGTVRIAAFVVPFFILVPQLGTTGASIAILVGIGSSAMMSVIWTRNFGKFAVFALASVAGGVLAGIITDILLDGQLLIVLVSVGTSS